MRALEKFRCMSMAAMIVSILALVMASTGGAYAASRYIITSSSHVKDGSLKERDFSAQARAKLNRLNGTNGANGAQGITGAQGNTGAQGEQGSPGAASAGSQGDVGAKGNAGADGIAGNNGLDGTNGIKGDTGAAGPQGPAGNDGSNGVDGAPGLDGAAGPQGEEGEEGAVGPAGNNGATGAKGDTGSTGPQGDKGVKGDTGSPGASATKAWATVNANGTIKRSTPGITAHYEGMFDGYPGAYVVKTNGSFAGYSFQVTNEGYTAPGLFSVYHPYGDTPSVGLPGEVVVYSYALNGSTKQQHAFSIAMIAP